MSPLSPGGDNETLYNILTVLQTMESVQQTMSDRLSDMENALNSCVLSLAAIDTNTDRIP